MGSGGMSVTTAVLAPSARRVSVNRSGFWTSGWRMTIVRSNPRSTWEAPPAVVAPDEAKRKKMFNRAMAFADEIGLDDEKRYELARMIPGVDKDGDGSWKELDAKQ